MPADCRLFADMVPDSGFQAQDEARDHRDGAGERVTSAAGYSEARGQVSAWNDTSGTPIISVTPGSGWICGYWGRR